MHKQRYDCNYNNRHVTNLLSERVPIYVRNQDVTHYFTQKEKTKDVTHNLMLVITSPKGSATIRDDDGTINRDNHDWIYPMLKITDNSSALGEKKML